MFDAALTDYVNIKTRTPLTNKIYNFRDTKKGDLDPPQKCYLKQTDTKYSGGLFWAIPKYTKILSG